MGSKWLLGELHKLLFIASTNIYWPPKICYLFLLQDTDMYSWKNKVITTPSHIPVIPYCRRSYVVWKNNESSWKRIGIQAFNWKGAIVNSQLPEKYETWCVWCCSIFVAILFCFLKKTLFCFNMNHVILLDTVTKKPRYNVK